MYLPRQPDPHATLWRLAGAAFAVGLAAIFAVAYAGRIPAIIGLLPHYDVYGHMALYGLLAYLMHRSLQRLGVRCGALTMPVGPVLILALAAAEELLQGLSPLRSASWRDLAADLAGMGLALLLDALWLRRQAGRRATGIA